MTDKKLLLVEDDDSLRRLLATILEQEGYELKTASNGARALDKLESWLPDLVICDIQMPVMDGFEFLKAVRTRADWQQLPFIFLTGLDSSEDQQLGRELGADDYLTKPASRDQLVAAIELRLGKHESLTGLHARRASDDLLIYLAAVNGDLDGLKREAERIGDIDQLDDQGNTPLMYAVMMRQEEAARYLIRQGANPDLRHPATGMRVGAMARAMELDI
ncbi:response regulator [Marinospirillum perlucidum]|uniref:response regulator n=1 Tax=Marinospirillum perlucidum TaxID=1982602 RepID=UPI000DF2489F|nr:response regulator [Marinospirillum perlucidum]